MTQPSTATKSPDELIFKIDLDSPIVNASMPPLALESSAKGGDEYGSEYSMGSEYESVLEHIDASKAVSQSFSKWGCLNGGKSDLIDMERIKRQLDFVSAELSTPPSYGMKPGFSSKAEITGSEQTNAAASI
jgi:hypothetical protein